MRFLKPKYMLYQSIVLFLNIVSQFQVYDKYLLIYVMFKGTPIIHDNMSDN